MNDTKCVECKHLLIEIGYCDKRKENKDLYADTCEDFNSREVWERFFHRLIMRGEE